MHEPISFLLPLATILIGGRLAGHLSGRWGMPAVFGELLLGLLIGPAVLGWITSSEALELLATLGALVLMFMAGLETDMQQMRNVGKTAFLTACGGVVLPLVAGYGLGRAFGLPVLHALFVGAVLTATSVSISAQVLKELGLLRSRIGTIILGAAVIDDVLGVVVLSVTLALAGSGSVFVALLKMAVFLPLAWFIGDRLVPRIVRWDAHFKTREGWLAVGLGLVLVYSWGAEKLGGVAAITGAYLAGVLVARHAHDEHIVHHGISALGYAFVVPIFFVSVGLHATPTGLTTSPWFTLTLVGIAIATKIVGCGVGALLSGCDRRGALQIGAGMVGRGEVALVMIVVGRTAGLVDDTLFSATVIMTLATTFATPPLLRWAFAPRTAYVAPARLDGAEEVLAT